MAAALAAAGDTVPALVVATIAATTVFARQVLMPAINRATDDADRRRFKILHSLSVLITLGLIAGAGMAILRLASG